MITLYGVTEDGVSVPVQVTEDGKLVVLNSGPKPGDDIECNNLDASGSITAAGSITGDQGSFVGDVAVGSGLGANSGSALKVTGNVIQLFPNGSITAAANKCGFTSSGELFFTSRNQRWKCVVQGGNVMAEEYTRATELREKSEQLREPKTQDIVPED